MEKDVGIEKIVLNTGDGVKVVITLEQAKKLKEILNDLFGKEVVKEVIHEHHHDWWYRPYYAPSWQWRDNVVYCSNAQNTSLGNALEITC